MVKKVAWLLSGAARGSGGFRTVLMHGEALSRAGYECDYYFYDSDTDGSVFSVDLGSRGFIASLKRKFKNPERAIRSKVAGMSGIADERIHYGWSGAISADIAFATQWDSAYALRDLPASIEKFYFVQDHEHFFHSRGDNFLAARNSYGFGFRIITIGRYLSYSLVRDFGADSYYFDFGADSRVYRPLSTGGEGREGAIAFIYQPKKDWRCARLGLEALSIVKSRLPWVKIYLYGSRERHNRYDVPFAHEHLGLLSVGECNALYNRCSLGLCLSASNPSRIPFEMMSSGLPVVELYGDNTCYDFSDSAMLLAMPDSESLASACMMLLEDESKRQALAKAGLAFMRGRDESYEVSQFVSLVDGLVSGDLIRQPAIEPLYKANPIEV